MKQSNINRVHLTKVSLATSGTYRCEVTSKNSPGFDAKVREAKMVVLGKDRSKQLEAMARRLRLSRRLLPPLASSSYLARRMNLSMRQFFRLFAESAGCWCKAGCRITQTNCCPTYYTS